MITSFKLFNTKFDFPALTSPGHDDFILADALHHLTVHGLSFSDDLVVDHRKALFGVRIPCDGLQREAVAAALVNRRLRLWRRPGNCFLRNVPWRRRLGSCAAGRGSGMNGAGSAAGCGLDRRPAHSRLPCILRRRFALVAARRFLRSLFFRWRDTVGLNFCAGTDGGRRFENPDNNCSSRDADRHKNPFESKTVRRPRLAGQGEFPRTYLNRIPSRGFGFGFFQCLQNGTQFSLFLCGPVLRDGSLLWVCPGRSF